MGIEQGSMQASGNEGGLTLRRQQNLVAEALWMILRGDLTPLHTARAGVAACDGVSALPINKYLHQHSMKSNWSCTYL